MSGSGAAAACALSHVDGALAQLLMDGCGLRFHDMKDQTRIVARQPLYDRRDKSDRQRRRRSNADFARRGIGKKFDLFNASLSSSKTGKPVLINALPYAVASTPRRLRSSKR